MIAQELEVKYENVKKILRIFKNMGRINSIKNYGQNKKR
jgi:hypothetical protein